jgi:hypothetical protein
LEFGGGLTIPLVFDKLVALAKVRGSRVRHTGVSILLRLRERKEGEPNKSQQKAEAESSDERRVTSDEQIRAPGAVTSDE